MQIRVWRMCIKSTCRHVLFGMLHGSSRVDCPNIDFPRLHLIHSSILLTHKGQLTVLMRPVYARPVLDYITQNPTKKDGLVNQRLTVHEETIKSIPK